MYKINLYKYINKYTEEKQNLDQFTYFHVLLTAFLEYPQNSTTHIQSIHVLTKPIFKTTSFLKNPKFNLNLKILLKLVEIQRLVD